MKLFLWTLPICCCCSYTQAQHVYQIRADSVRIYNTCDTAELILENRTQNTLGFLYNKGKGRTEFRKLELKAIGNDAIAIVGQDTLQLSAMGKIAVDTMYNRQDTLYYRKTDGQMVAVKLNLPPRPHLYGTVTSVGVSSTDITVAGAPVTSSGTISLTLPNIATAGTYRSLTVNAKGQVTAGTNPTTLAGYGITDAANFFVSRTASTTDPAASTVYNSDLNAVTGSSLFHIGATVTNVPAAANPAYVLSAGNNTSNSAAKTQMLLSYNIDDGFFYRKGANVSSWSNWYRVASREWVSGNAILNNSSSAQIAAAWITGHFRASSFMGPLIETGSSAGTLNIIGGSSPNYRGAEIALRAGGTGVTTPGEMTFHTGISGAGAVQPERMRIDVNGKVGIGGELAVGTALSSGVPFTVNKSVAVGNSTAYVSNLNNTAGTYGLVVNTANTAATTYPFVVRSNGANIINITGTGYVGLGNVNPTARLDIATNNNVELQFTGASAANIYHATSAQDLYLNTNTGKIYLGANGSGSQHITVLSSGNVGIGTNAPTATLHVNGSVVYKTRTIVTTGTAVIAATDHVVKLSTGSTGGTANLTLPDPTVNEGRELQLYCWAGSNWNTNYPIERAAHLGPPITSIAGFITIIVIGGTWIYKSDSN